MRDVSESKDPSEKKTPAKRGRCPRCGHEFKYASVAEHKFFPFCCKRCRDVDLGNWLTGKYVIPGSEADPEELDKLIDQIEESAGEEDAT